MKIVLYFVILFILIGLVFLNSVQKKNAKDIKELRKEYKELRLQFAELQHRINVLEQFNPDANTPQGLLYELKKAGVPDAEDWVNVAVMETGDRNKPSSPFVCGHVTMANNPFCFHAIDHPLVAGTWSKYPNSEQIARFATQKDCIYFLKWWCEQSPRKAGQPFENWLKIRGFNPNPNYYTLLAKL